MCYTVNCRWFDFCHLAKPTFHVKQRFIQLDTLKPSRVVDLKYTETSSAFVFHVKQRFFWQTRSGNR
jgi:hypothetical protein